MTEIYPSPLLQKYVSNRTSADVLAMILYISEGIYALKSNNREPKFSTIEEFDASAAEILGSLSEETFPQLVQMLLFEPEYLNRFIQISVERLDNAIKELRKVLNLEIPLSAASIQRISAITNKTDFLIQELAQISTDLPDFITTESLTAISGLVIDSQDFKVNYIEEIQRSMSYVRDFRDN